MWCFIVKQSLSFKAIKYISFNNRTDKYPKKDNIQTVISTLYYHLHPPVRAYYTRKSHCENKKSVTKPWPIKRETIFQNEIQA